MRNHSKEHSFGREVTFFSTDRTQRVCVFGIAPSKSIRHSANRIIKFAHTIHTKKSMCQKKEMSEIIAGVDEVRIGPLCGPIVGAVVILPDSKTDELDVSNLCDSKRLTERKRALMYEQITNTCKYGIGFIEREELDEIGLAVSRRLIFHRAIDNLFKRNPNTTVSRFIVDGTLFEPYGNIPYTCEPKADARYACVSAASIIAKHVGDMWVYNLCDDEPEMAKRYDWKKNKCYPTPKHLEAIKQFGVTKYHRMTYGPCKNIVNNSVGPDLCTQNTK